MNASPLPRQHSRYRKSDPGYLGEIRQECLVVFSPTEVEYNTSETTETILLPYRANHRANSNRSSLSLYPGVCRSHVTVRGHDAIRERRAQSLSS